MTAEAELMDLDAEAQVIQRLKQGDREAAAELYRWYAPRLYRQAILPRLPVRELAEDVLKDSFRIALEKIGTFESIDRSIFFWLRRIAIHRAVDVHRAHQRRRRQEARTTPDETAHHIMATPPPSPDRAPQVAETREMVELSLSRLNARYAQALRMRLLEELSREECAEALGVKVGNFDVIFHRATKAFRKGYPP